MKKNHLTYVYQNGRKNRLAKENYPKEFFYGLDFLKSQFETFDVVEFSKDNTFDSMIADRSKRFFNYRVHLGNCYPKSVSAIEFKHESRDERVKITVNFTYEKVLYDREIKT